MPDTNDNQIQQPQSGGRYERKEDGSLTHLEGTKEPTAAEVAQRKAARQQQANQPATETAAPATSSRAGGKKE